MVKRVVMEKYALANNACTFEKSFKRIDTFTAIFERNSLKTCFFGAFSKLEADWSKESRDFHLIGFPCK